LIFLICFVEKEKAAALMERSSCYNKNNPIVNPTTYSTNSPYIQKEIKAISTSKSPNHSYDDGSPLRNKV